MAAAWGWACAAAWRLWAAWVSFWLLGSSYFLGWVLGQLASSCVAAAGNHAAFQHWLIIVAPAGMGMGGMGMGMGAAGGDRTGKQPDWICSECQNKNFGWRQSCNRCKVCVRRGLRMVVTSSAC